MHRIGFISDERMLAHECIWVPSFPEMPHRLKAALDRIHEYGLLDRCVNVPVSYPLALNYLVLRYIRWHRISETFPYKNTTPAVGRHMCSI